MSNHEPSCFHLFLIMISKNRKDNHAIILIHEIKVI